MGTIEAQIVIANDLQARRISAAENLQREDLSAIETIEAIVEIVNVELIEDVEYSSTGRTPVDGVKAVLGRLHSIISNKNRGSQVSKKAELILSKFTSGPRAAALLAHLSDHSLVLVMSSNPEP